MLSIAFEERDGPRMASRLESFTSLYSANLLEAEMRAAHLRERREFDPRRLHGIEILLPDRPLSPEITAALQIRYLRSGDLLHVATALYAVRDFNLDLAFITLDNNQREVADGLGFAT